MPPITRRRFLAGLAAAGAPPMLPARVPLGRLFIGCRVDREGRHLASVFDRSGRVHRDIPLPGRGHGFAVQPATGRVVVFARRPGDWAFILEPATGAVLGRICASAGRHFYGHGAFSPDGALLYTSENRFEDGAGVIGVWDTARGWRAMARPPRDTRAPPRRDACGGQWRNPHPPGHGPREAQPRHHVFVACDPGYHHRPAGALGIVRVPASSA